MAKKKWNLCMESMTKTEILAKTHKYLKFFDINLPKSRILSKTREIVWEICLNHKEYM